MQRSHVGFGSALLLALAAAGAGCSNSTGGNTCTADKDCPAGSRCQSGACQAYLTVEITRPAQSSTSLCGTLHVEVSVADASGGSTSAVELRANDRVLATLGKPFTYDWDTAKEAEGSYQLVARVPAGSQHYDSAAKTVVVDCTAPAAPQITQVASPTNLTSIPVTGVAEVGATVRVYEGSNLLGQAVASATTGAWTVSVALAEGARSIFATATDAAGNASGPSAEAAVVVDRTAPASPALSATSPTRVDPVAVAGSAEPGSRVQVFDGATPVGSAALAQGDGTWSAQVPLAEGSHTLTATATDAAGNASAASAAVPLVVDRTAPAAPSLSATTPTRASPVPVSGTAEPGATVRLYDGGAPVGPDIAAAGGTWSASLTLAEGTHPLTATATDAAGNTSAASAATSVAVDRTPPVPPILVAPSPTGSNTVDIGGSAEPASTVRLYEGATRIGSDLVALTLGTFSGKVTLAAGSHALTATATDPAGNTSGLSDPLTVVVDQTAPAVVSTVPANLATNVFSRDPIVVTFSEPILGSSVTPQTVRLTAAGLEVAVQSRVLSSGGQILTVTLSPAGLPAVPATVIASLSGLTDLAGNALADTSWSWSLPEWQDLGSTSPSSTYAVSGSVAATANATPALAYYLCDGFCDTYVSQWSGASWVRPPLIMGTTPSIDVDGSGRLAVASLGYDNSYRLIVAKESRWDGTTWTTDTLNLAAANTASNPTLRIDPSGRHVVSWLETVSGVTGVYAKRWDGTSWSQLGSGTVNSTIPSTATPTNPVASVDPDGSPRVSWLDAIGFNSCSWSGSPAQWMFDLYLGLGTANPAASSYLYRASPAKKAFRAYLEATSATPPVSLLKVQANITQLPCASGWCVLGPSVNGGALNASLAVSAGAFGMAFDANALPVVAWVEGGNTLWAKRWDGQAWVALGSKSFSPAGYTLFAPAVAVAQNGAVVVSFLASAQGGLNKSAWVMRYNR